METVKQISRVKKYVYYLVIQQYCGGSWEDASFYECDSTGWIKGKENRDILKHDKGEYILMGYPVRVIKRRELSAGYSADLKNENLIL